MVAKKPPSKTTIRNILRSLAFDPRKPGPMSLIAEVGDAGYYITRAIEELRMADFDNKRNTGKYINNAIRLLVLAKESRGEVPPTTPAT